MKGVPKMKVKFLHLTGFDNLKLAVVAQRVTAIGERSDFGTETLTTYVYVTGCEEPFAVMESYETVLNMLDIGE
jgi:hypothetical protein